jgi:hypothetical protein
VRWLEHRSTTGRSPRITYYKPRHSIATCRVHRTAKGLLCGEHMACVGRTLSHGAASRLLSNNSIYHDYVVIRNVLLYERMDARESRGLRFSASVSRQGRPKREAKSSSDVIVVRFTYVSRHCLYSERQSEREREREAIIEGERQLNTRAGSPATRRVKYIAINERASYATTRVYSHVELVTRHTVFGETPGAKPGWRVAASAVVSVRPPVGSRGAAILA